MVNPERRRVFHHKRDLTRIVLGAVIEAESSGHGVVLLRPMKGSHGVHSAGAEYDNIHGCPIAPNLRGKRKR